MPNLGNFIIMRWIFYIAGLIIVGCTIAGEPENPPLEKDSVNDLQFWHKDIIEMKLYNDTNRFCIIESGELFQDRWDTLGQAIFWKKIMALSPDSCLINIAKNRKIIVQLAIDEWDQKTDEEKESFKDSIRLLNKLNEEDKIYMTSGKSDFYKFDHILLSIGKGIELFDESEVDPWYAQAILMIESPGKMAKSNVGAYGSFQLMPSVARKMGLTVNKTIDERKDFEKSAKAAAKFIKDICIPNAKIILDNYQISYDEKSLWFRFFVLHVYHAGAGNVSAVLDVIKPENGGGELIQKMWVSTGGQFKNASQNYSQLALAAMITLEDIIWLNCEELDVNN